jgi:hypothetical protein
MFIIAWKELLVVHYSLDNYLIATNMSNSDFVIVSEIPISCYAMQAFLLKKTELLLILRYWLEVCNQRKFSSPHRFFSYG